MPDTPVETGDDSDDMVDLLVEFGHELRAAGVVVGSGDVVAYCTAAAALNPADIVGLACFGEAIPAQAISQVCELVWQLRGQATGRQVDGARVGITANQGLFGHGSSVIVVR